jgi:proton-dependent oligopeptide transporter, POT family
MSSRKIEMPNVVSKEEYIEQASKALKMPISEFENKFDLKQDTIDWQLVGEKVNQFALSKGVNITNVQLPFSKSQYFALAEQKLQMSHWELTQLLWETYQPNKLWIVIFGIGIFSVITLSIYDRFVIKPLEKEGLLND